MKSAPEAFCVLLIPSSVVFVRDSDFPKQTSHSRRDVGERLGLDSIVRSKPELLIAAVFQAATSNSTTIKDIEVQAGFNVIKLYFFNEIPHDVARPGAVNVWWGVAENLTDLLQADLGPASFGQELYSAIKPGSKHLGIHDAIDEAGRCVPCIVQAVRIGCQGSVALFFVSRLLGAFFVLTARPGTVNSAHDLDEFSGSAAKLSDSAGTLAS